MMASRVSYKIYIQTVDNFTRLSEVGRNRKEPTVPLRIKSAFKSEEPFFSKLKKNSHLGERRVGFDRNEF